MAYSIEQKTNIINKICDLISYEGHSLRKACKIHKFPEKTFLDWISKDEEYRQQYARACEARADTIFEEILELSDDSKGDREAFVGVNRIHRHKLQIDSRKWILAKMNPKKYGEKLDVTSDGGKLNNQTIIEVQSKETASKIEKLKNKFDNEGD